MMFKRIQQRFLRKHINKNLKKRDTSKINEPLKTLGFLVDEDLFNDFEKLFDISREIGLQQKDVKVFTFIRVKKKSPSLRQNQINNKHFTWKGEIDNQNAKEFLDFPFDVLVGYYKGNHEFLNYMMSSSKAKFKVGFSGTDERLSDLLIDVDLMNVQKFKHEFLKYLRVLNKIN